MKGGLKYLPARISAVGYAFDPSPDAFAITTVAGRTGPRFLHVNPAFERLCGYAAEELIGASPRLLQGAETDAYTMRHVREAVRRQEAISAELLNYRKNGNAYWVELSIAPLANREGRVTHFMAVERDVTSRRSLAPDLQPGPAAGMLPAATDMTLVVDAQNQIFASSGGFLSAFGWREADLLGSPASLIVVEEHSRRMRTSAERGEVRRRISVRIRTGAGRFESLLADMSPFMVAGRPLCQLVTILPIAAPAAGAHPPAAALPRLPVPVGTAAGPAVPPPVLDGRMAGLTPRETEVLLLLPSGISNQAIADRLGLAEVTVKLHLRSAYRKMGVDGRPGAIRLLRESQRAGRKTT